MVYKAQHICENSVLSNKYSVTMKNTFDAVGALVGDVELALTAISTGSQEAVDAILLSQNLVPRDPIMALIY